MRYDDYRNRVLKVARVFSWIRRHIVMLSVILITIACLIGATLALMGTVLWNQYPGNMIYGDVPAPQAIAWLSPVSFEYRTENGEWTSTVPKLTGNYQVRSVGTTLVGKPRYGAVGSFTIAPKAIEVKVDNGQVIYDETPNISAATVFNDRLICKQFVYEDILQDFSKKWKSFHKKTYRFFKKGCISRFASSSSSRNSRADMRSTPVRKLDSCTSASDVATRTA